MEAVSSPLPTCPARVQVVYHSILLWLRALRRRGVRRARPNQNGFDEKALEEKFNDTQSSRGLT